MTPEDPEPEEHDPRPRNREAKTPEQDQPRPPASTIATYSPPIGFIRGK